MNVRLFVSFILCVCSYSCTKPADPPSMTTRVAPVNTEQRAEVAVAPSAAPASAVTAAAVANTSVPTGATNSVPDLTVDSNGLSKAIVSLKIKDKGVVKFKLYPKDAPNTVNRFIELVQSKFYNGLAFHRVAPGFVVQAGDPKSKNRNDPSVGTGGSGQKLKAEFNGRKHIRGAVAMARATDPDSADSQFYITLAAFPQLDQKYTVFGQTIDFGEKIADKDILDRISPWDEIIEIKIE